MLQKEICNVREVKVETGAAEARRLAEGKALRRHGARGVTAEGRDRAAEARRMRKQSDGEEKGSRATGKREEARRRRQQRLADVTFRAAVVIE
ncbi:hypothetical protein PIB30_054850 [Stylosanthes scabra]|uniref:Uncharacterized protein n=1 Tax=Stylosanthes scabra TaxID=79078 RepID=A0ABU6TL26_9FABA|nr:hypothetical protein [Stylosanthes scabra]